MDQSDSLYQSDRTSVAPSQAQEYPLNAVHVDADLSEAQMQSAEHFPEQAHVLSPVRSMALIQEHERRNHGGLLASYSENKNLSQSRDDGDNAYQLGIA